MTENPFSSLYQYDDALRSGILMAISMLNTMNSIGVENINRMCGGDVSPIVESVELIHESLSALQYALRQVLLRHSFARMSYALKLTLLIVRFLSWQVAPNWVQSIRRFWRKLYASILLKD